MTLAPTTRAYPNMLGWTTRGIQDNAVRPCNARRKAVDNLCRTGACPVHQDDARL